MKKRIFGTIAALLLAVVGTVLLVGYVRGAESRALEGEEVVDVLVVGSLINQGSPSESIAPNVKLEQVPSKVAIDGAISDLESLEGLVASQDLLPGEQVTRSRFIEQTSLNNYARSIDAPAGLLEVSLALDPERVVGGSISPGDMVAVVASFEGFDISGVILPENFNASLTKEELDELEKIYFIDDKLLAGDTIGATTHILTHKVVVTHVQEEEKPRTPVTGTDEESLASPDLAPTGKLIVTVAVDAPTIERLVFTQEFGSIWLAAEPSDASEDGTRLVTRGNVFEDSE